MIVLDVFVALHFSFLHEIVAGINWKEHSGTTTTTANKQKPKTFFFFFFFNCIFQIHLEEYVGFDSVTSFF